MIKNCIFLVLVTTFFLPVLAFAQESSTPITSHANAEFLGFPSLKSVKSDSTSLDYFNVELLQGSYANEKKNKKGRTLRNIGMGFTLTSIIGGIVGGVLIGASFIPFSKGDTNTSIPLLISGATLVSVTGALFLPGVIMWPIGVSMLND